MKKKLLVISLVFCCVWGVFASKLTDAAAKGDFDTMKKQIELLDYDVKGDWELLYYCMNGWNGIDPDKKKCIDYLMSKGAVINYSKPYRHYYDTYDAIDYMYKMKYDDVNKIWEHKHTMFEKLLQGIDNFDAAYSWIKILYMLPYNPTVTIDSKNYDLITGNITGNLQAIKNRLKRGEKFSGQGLLFVNNPKVIELLKAVDAYELPEGFNTHLTNDIIREIIPKYCTHITTKDQIDFMKFIANYKSSTNYEQAVEMVKAFKEKGVLEETPKMFRNKPLWMLPIELSNSSAFKLLMETCDLPITYSKKIEYDTGKVHGYNGKVDTPCPVECCGKYVLWMFNGWEYHIAKFDNDGIFIEDEKYNPYSPQIVNLLKEKAKEDARIAAEKAEQERIEQERKAEEERIAREKKAEENLMTDYLPQFCDNIRNLLLSYGTLKKGVYKIKSKKFESLATRQSLNSSVYRIFESYTQVLVKKAINNGVEFIYSFYLSDGYTVKNVQKVWNMAVDKVCDEFGIQ